MRGFCCCFEFFLLFCWFCFCLLCLFLTFLFGMFLNFMLQSHLQSVGGAIALPVSVLFDGLRTSCPKPQECLSYLHPSDRSTVVFTWFLLSRGAALVECFGGNI